MYGLNDKIHELKVYGEYFTKDQAVPQNTNADGNQGPIVMEGDLASQEVVGRVGSAITIAATTTITIKLMHAPDDGTGNPGAYTDLDTVFTAGDGTIAADAELFRFVPPTNVQKYVKVNVATTDAAATGTLSVFPSYLPR